MVSSLLSTQNRSLMILALAIATLFVSRGLSTYSVLAEKAEAQHGSTVALSDWSQSYQAVAEAAKAWKQMYPVDNQVGDLKDNLYGLLRLNSYGLETDIDNFGLGMLGQKPVDYNGTVIGLTRVCLETRNTASGSGGLVVTAADYGKLFTGIKQLSARRDIDIARIEFLGDKTIPTARLNDLCLLLRAAEGKS